MYATADYLKLHIVVLLFGFTAILGKLITLPPVEMVFYRTLLAAIGMPTLLTLRRQPLRVGTKEGLIIFLTGFIVAAHWITFFLSARISNVSVSLVGFATASLWTALLDPIVSRQRIRALELTFGIAVIIGLYVIFAADFSYVEGLIMAIVSGLTCAIFSIINSKMVRRVGASQITLYEMAGACIAIALYFPLYVSEGNELQLMPSGSDWIGLLTLAWVCSVYAYSVAVEIMKRMPVFFVQLTMNMEPIYGILLAVLIFGSTEKMDFSFYTGTAIVLMSVLLYPAFKRRFTTTQPTREGH